MRLVSISWNTERAGSYKVLKGRQQFVPVVFGDRAAGSPEAVDIHEEVGAGLGGGDAAQVVVRIKRLTDTRTVADDERLARLWLAVDGGALPLGEEETGRREALRPEQRLGDPVAPLDTAVDARRGRGPRGRSASRCVPLRRATRPVRERPRRASRCRATPRRWCSVVVSMTIAWLFIDAASVLSRLT